MEFLKKIAVFLKLKEHDADFKPEHLKFGEAKLETGETVTWEGDELLVAMPIAIVTPEGALPMPDGKHITTDGMTIVVEGGQGIITEIIPAVVEEEPVEQGVEGAAVTEPVKEVVEQVAKRDVERIIQERERIFSDEKEAAITSLKTAHEKEIAQLTELITKQNEVIEKFNSQPAATPVQEKFALTKKKSTWMIESFAQK
jgi:hypothetical protein